MNSLPPCPAEDWPDCHSNRHHYHRHAHYSRWPGGSACTGDLGECDDEEPGVFTRCYGPRVLDL